MQARSTGEPELLQAQRRRREQREGARRPRRKRSSTPWIQRNALSVAAVSVLIAFLGLGFGLVQMLNRGENAPAALTLAQSELPVATNGPAVIAASSVGSAVQLTVPSAPTRNIQATTKVLDPNYTIVAGDTLVKIAQRFNTTVERVQAFNNLSDPRALRIGTKLVIPPPL
jgi:LysM repeat protein